MPVARDWIVYLPVLATSILLMVPAVFLAATQRIPFLATILLIAVSQLSQLFWPLDPIVVVVALVTHFTGFTIMEALLPSLITKVAPANAKGTAAVIDPRTAIAHRGVGDGGLAQTFDLPNQMHQEARGSR